MLQRNPKVKEHTDETAWITRLPSGRLLLECEGFETPQQTMPEAITTMPASLTLYHVASAAFDKGYNMGFKEGEKQTRQRVKDALR